MSKVYFNEMTIAVDNVYSLDVPCKPVTVGPAGVAAAYKKGESIKSERLKNTAVKMLVYNLLLMSSFIAETYLTPWIPFTNITLSFLAIVEVKSLGENFHNITGINFIIYLKSYLNNKLNTPK